MRRSHASPHPTPTAYLAQASALYESAGESIQQEGRRWYFREHDEAIRLAEGSGYPLHIVCACLAVLSPRCQWRRVKKACELLLRGRKPPGIFSHNLNKAASILATRRTDLIQPDQAPKTWAFWQNLWRPDDPEPVTLDSWMFRSHGLPVGSGLRTYHVLANAYRQLASQLGLLPCQLQAVVWLHAKATLSSRRNGCSGKRSAPRRNVVPHRQPTKEEINDRIDP
jgi:hypothetical protein